MASSRESAINNEYDKSRNGRPGFEYVNTQILDRLGITKYKTEASDNFIRIMPPKDDTVMWAREVWVHRNIGANGVTLLCPKKMYNKPCPVCEAIEAMKAAKASDDEIKTIVATRRYLMFVYDVRNDETIAKGLRWYDAPGIVISNIVLLSKDKRTKEIIDVCDPVDGRDIEFVRKGSGLSSKYEAFNLVKTEAIPKEWYANIPDFDDVLSKPSYDQIKSEFDGGVDDSGQDSQPNDNGEGNEPVKQDSVSPSRRRPSPDQEREEPTGETSDQGSRGEVSSRGNRRVAEEVKPVSNGVTSSVKDKIEEIRRRRGV